MVKPKSLTEWIAARRQTSGWIAPDDATKVLDLIEALSNESEQWRRHGTAFTIPAANDVRQSMNKTDAAISRLMGEQC